MGGGGFQAPLLPDTGEAMMKLKSPLLLQSSLLPNEASPPEVRGSS